MRGPKPLYVMWVLAFAAVAAITLNGKRESTDFQGIAETREVIINAENAVEIKAFHVVPGQEVKKGKLLVELDQPELTKKINEIAHQLEELNVQRKADAGKAASHVKQLRAEEKAVASEIDYKIRQLESRRALNKRLASGLKSIEQIDKADKTADIKSPVDLQIESLQKERELALNRIQLQIDAIRGGQDPLAVRAESLEKQLRLLDQEKRGLLIFARIDGVIGSVHFKRGEKVSPFVPILTLYTKSPSYVRGFIHEKVYNRVAIGNEVQIVSLTGNNGNGIKTGEVVGVGSRIVEYPYRLQKRPDIQIWGREVQIRLPAENDFLLGEKVMIRSPGNGVTYGALAKNFVEKLKSHIPGKPAYAAIETPGGEEKKRPAGPVAITAREKALRANTIEASGLAYLADLKKNLLISDDTADDAPILWLMGRDGMIEKEVRVAGLDRIDDMEAICAGAGNDMYIVCSQSANKSGKVPADRQWLVQVERNGSQLAVKNAVRLRELLKTAAKQDKNSEWVTWLSLKHHFNMNVEGMFWHLGDLYVGLKRPLKDNRAVILRIKNIGDALSTPTLACENVAIWKTFDLKGGTGVPAGISDLHLQNGRLFILSYAKIDDQDLPEKSGIEKSGNLWRFDMGKNRLGFVRYFPNRQPEGLAYNSDENELVIVFDGGGDEPSELLTIKDA